VHGFDAASRAAAWDVHGKEFEMHKPVKLLFASAAFAMMEIPSKMF
jgi:hypothetical protein